MASTSEIRDEIRDLEKEIEKQIVIRQGADSAARKCKKQIDELKNKLIGLLEQEQGRKK